ncbi:MAG: bifunctional diguanylate cyclase/phosphodiesterase [Hyphomicrobiales bacterium]|nr:bifunctional diguanylate cyclase/phosphodiesterase [Hyphomicrobiales bacterium]MDE2016087.1 bifunctional diguanylate cyclase/phosphodiesterase [Hyphomicrobiales bacterium]
MDRERDGAKLAAEVAANEDGADDSPDALSALTAIGEVVYDWDIVSDRLTFGPSVGEVLAGVPALALRSGANFAELLSADSLESRHRAIHDSAEPADEQGAPYRARYALAPAGGRRIEIEDGGRWFADADGRPVRAHGVMRRLRGVQLRATSHERNGDPTTGALGRAAFVAHVARRLESAAATRGAVGVALVRIDNLAALNRVHGYDAGDATLRAVAGALRASMRSGDRIARFGGACFALALEGCDGERLAAAAERFADAATAAGIEFPGAALRASVRVGGAVGPDDGRCPQALLQHAEEALAHARARGAKRCATYSPSLAWDDARLRAIAISDEIVSALNERRLEMALQPIVPTRGGAPIHEALARLRRDDGTLCGAASFVPVAERAGLLGLVDHRMLELARDRLVARPDATLAVNVSVGTLRDPGWPDRMAHVFAAAPGAARRLYVEISETAATADVEAAAESLAAVRSMGVRVAIDDFGAGHSSFRALRALGVDLVKIDGAFVRDLARSADDRFFVRTLVALGRHLGAPVVAEWVEDAETAALLADWGVDYLQGHHFGAARSPDEIDAAQPAAPRLIYARR